MDTRLVGRVIDIARSVNPLLAVSAAVLDPRQSAAHGGVRAQVAARLADGTFRVLIDGKALKLALPEDVKAGDILQLRVVDRPGTGGAAAPGATAGGLSAAGQLVAKLAEQPSSTPPRQSQPIVAEANDLQGPLAEPLARAVARSGLFYESHQARWVSGDFPLERLLEEPQAQAGQARTEPATASTPDADDRPAPAPAPRLALVHAEEGETTDAHKPLQATATTELDDMAADRRNELLARETVPMVRQQLETLETRHFTWLGEIWPGQPMRWQIGEEPDGENAGAGADHEWDSRFALDLPALGNVGAELALAGERLRIRMSAADEATVALMRECGSELARALQAAGIDTVSFEVQQRESTF